MTHIVKVGQPPQKIIHMYLEKTRSVSGGLMIFMLRLAAQAFPCDWLGSKLQLEVYMEDTDLICTSESPAREHTALNFSNFDGTSLNEF